MSLIKERFWFLHCVCFVYICVAYQLKSRLSSKDLAATWVETIEEVGLPMRFHLLWVYGAHLCSPPEALWQPWMWVGSQNCTSATSPRPLSSRCPSQVQITAACVTNYVQMFLTPQLTWLNYDKLFLSNLIFWYYFCCFLSSCLASPTMHISLFRNVCWNDYDCLLTQSLFHINICSFHLMLRSDSKSIIRMSH